MTERTRARSKKPSKLDGVKTIRVISKLKTVDGEEIAEEIEVEQFEVEPAYVRAGAGVTRNLGDYESLRVDVSITIPCYKEDIERTYDVAADMVAAYLQDEVDKYLKDEGK
jgi:hypothetical protein